MKRLLFLTLVIGLHSVALVGFEPVHEPVHGVEPHERASGEEIKAAEERVKAAAKEMREKEQEIREIAERETDVKARKVLQAMLDEVEARWVTVDASIKPTMTEEELRLAEDHAAELKQEVAGINVEAVLTQRLAEGFVPAGEQPGRSAQEVAAQVTKLPEHTFMRSLYEGLASVAEAVGFTKLAISFNKKLLDIYKNAGEFEKLSKTTGKVGDFYKKLGNYNEALQYHNTVYQEAVEKYNAQQTEANKKAALEAAKNVIADLLLSYDAILNYTGGTSLVYAPEPGATWSVSGSELTRLNEQKEAVKSVLADLGFTLEEVSVTLNPYQVLELGKNANEYDILDARIKRASGGLKEDSRDIQEYVKKLREYEDASKVYEQQLKNYALAKKLGVSAEEAKQLGLPAEAPQKPQIPELSLQEDQQVAVKEAQFKKAVEILQDPAQRAAFDAKASGDNENLTTTVTVKTFTLKELPQQTEPSTNPLGEL